MCVSVRQVTETVERTEILQPEQARALGSLLDVPVPDLDGGAGLPLLWHWIYLLDRPAQADLGPDGHPVRGTIPAPPGPGRRRMWAGGRVHATGALRCGEPATRRSQVQSMRDKQGRSGPLTFITMHHQVLQRGQVVIDEQQDLVYREAAAPAKTSAAPAQASAGSEGAGSERADQQEPGANQPAEPLVVPPGDGERAIEVSPTLLFRYSALTYNAHRIHYDRDYARDVEGYPGLLTHGPLQAIAMAEAARATGYPGSGHDAGGPGLVFEYRLLSPLFDHQGLIVRAERDQDAIITTVRDIYARQSATGTLHRA
jgi:3-methylfumaryl-CoA hydratase